MFNPLKPVNWDAVSGYALIAGSLAGFAALLFTGIQIRDFREEAKVQHLIDKMNHFVESHSASRFGMVSALAMFRSQSER